MRKVGGAQGGCGSAKAEKPKTEKLKFISAFQSFSVSEFYA